MIIMITMMFNITIDNANNNNNNRCIVTIIIIIIIIEIMNIA